jgi:hypothetical protein
VPSACVDVDSVRPDIGMRHRCMAVNDESSVRLRRVEELVTNPYEIVDILPFDRNAGTNAGVYKQEISAAKTVAEASQEQIVRMRKNATKAPLQVGFRLPPRMRENSIGCKGLHAT